MNSASTKTATGPKGYPLVGVFPKMKQDAVSFFRQTAREHGEVALLDFGLQKVYLVTGPGCIKHVLQDRHQNYIRGRAVDSARLLLGNGLALNNGSSWLRQRRLIQPAFHRERLAQLAERIVGFTQQTAGQWEQRAAAGDPVDVSEEMMRLTLKIVVKSMFSEEISNRLDELSHAFDIAQHFIYWRGRNPLAAPLWAPTRSNRRFFQARDRLDSIIYELIRKRRAQPQGQNDLLDMLLAARDEATNEGMSDRQLRDEIMTIFFAGHETTMTLLTWSWYVLDAMPEVEDALQREVAKVLDGSPPSFPHLAKFDYLPRMLNETLRFYPPTWIFSRESLESDVIEGYPIPAGANLLISPIVTHHLPEYWTEPERFDPDRFLPEQAAKRHRYAFLPFGAGPHLCIGKNFAMMEAQLIMSLLPQRFRLKRLSNQPVEFAPRVTLRPKHPMEMSIHLR
jgi:cytochrome P450